MLSITNGVDTIYSDQESVLVIGLSLFSGPNYSSTFVESTIDDYPVSETIDVNETLDFTVTASLANADITNSTNVDNLRLFGKKALTMVLHGQIYPLVEIMLFHTTSQISASTTL